MFLALPFALPKSSMPKTRKAFWRGKFEDNKRRDRRIRRILTKQGWRVIVIWECETKDSERLKKRLIRDLRVPMKTVELIRRYWRLSLGSRSTLASNRLGQ